MFSKGSYIYNKFIEKKGIVKYLRDDMYEKEQRKSNPNHFYYYIDYEDGSFDTYVNGANLNLDSNSNLNSNLNSNSNLSTNAKYTNSWDIPYENNNYAQGHLLIGRRFVCKYSDKSGSVRSVRDDEYEKEKRKSDPTHWYYYVDFDDGTYETYMSGKSILLN